MKHLIAASALIALAACSQPPAPSGETPAATTAPEVTIPAGAYTLDMSHTSLIFRVNHLGFSHYTGRFTDFTGQLQLDPANPSASTLNVSINPRSLTADGPPAGFLDDLKGPQWLDATQFPEMTYRSTSIEVTGANTARITGDFTMHGVTKPVTLEATFNGGYAGHPMDPNARAGFSAHGTLKRSEFGIANGVPAPGTTMGVSDDVEIIIETEWSGPAWTAPAETP